MKVIRDLFDLQGALEWARCIGGTEPLTPPFIAWRFEKPDERIENKIVEAIQSYSGLVEWVIDKGGRNWVIQPAAFQIYSTKFREGEACQRFASEFPVETRAAIDDIASLVAHLKITLDQLSVIT